jgi:hypothetical protein
MASDRFVIINKQQLLCLYPSENRAEFQSLKSQGYRYQKSSITLREAKESSAGMKRQCKTYNVQLVHESAKFVDIAPRHSREVAAKERQIDG